MSGRSAQRHPSPFALLLAACVLAVTPGSSPAQQPQRESDDAFIVGLAELPDDAPVDRRRLSKVLFSIGAALDSGRTGVRGLENYVPEAGASSRVPATSDRRSVRGTVRIHYQSFENSLAQYRASVSDLLDAPHSNLLFYDTWTTGQRTCWQLDMYLRLIETYGEGPDMMTVLPTLEACARLRTAAFHPRVESIIREALVDQVLERRELADLLDDLSDLERLFKDLERIDAAE